MLAKCVFYLAVLLVLGEPVVLGGGSGQRREAFLRLRQEPMFFVVTLVPRTVCSLLGLLRRGRAEPAHEIDFGHIYVGSARTETFKWKLEREQRSKFKTSLQESNTYLTIDNIVYFPGTLSLLLIVVLLCYA